MKGGEALRSNPVFRGWVLAIGSTVLYSFAPIANKIGISMGLYPTNLLILRLWVTTALLLPYGLFFRKSGMSIDRKGMIFTSIAGFFQSIAMVAFIWSLVHLEVSLVTMSFSLYPVIVFTGIGIISGGISILGFVQFAIGLAGIYFLVGPSGAMDTYGLFLVGIGVLSFSIYMIIAHYKLTEYKPRETTTYLVLTMSVLTTGFWLFTGGEWDPPSLIAWGVILFLAVVVSFVAQALLLSAVQKIGSEEVALLAPAEMLLTVSWAILFLGERLIGVQWIGAVLIVISVGFSAKRLQLISADRGGEMGLPGPS